MKHQKRKMTTQMDSADALQRMKLYTMFEYYGKSRATRLKLW